MLWRNRSSWCARYTEHGASHEVGLSARGSAPGCARLSREGAAAGHGRIRLLRNRQESAAQSFEEIKSDLVLSNGARFYNDHAHPEYSTPECTTLRQIVAHDKAGERILADARAGGISICADGQRGPALQEQHRFRRATATAATIIILCGAIVPWERIVAGRHPVPVTRQIFAGAGKLGFEGGNCRRPAGNFQISQRADFFSVSAQHRHDEPASAGEYARRAARATPAAIAASTSSSATRT